jgi:hypothetical protein
MRKVRLYLSAVVVLWMTAGTRAKETSAGSPGCAHESPKQCVNLTLEAMGGRERLQQVKSVRLRWALDEARRIVAEERGHPA